MQQLELTPQDIRRITDSAWTHGGNLQGIRRFFHDDFFVIKVKENPIRQIYRLIPAKAGSGFYFKYYHHVPCFKYLFHFAPRIEYRTAQWADSLGLPMLRYAAWGRTWTGGFVISQELNVLQARQYIFRTVYHDESLRTDFFRKLAAFCHTMLEMRILHPDFHLGNLLVRCDNSSLVLADPPGMRRVWRVTEQFRRTLLVPWREMFGVFSDEILAGFVVQAGLCATETDALAMLTSATEEYRAMRQAHYAKIRMQVLSGNSKYTRDFEADGKRYSFHHNLYFSFPSCIEIDSEWERRDFKGIATSERLWINSMLYQDCREKQPVLRVLYPDGNSSLYYTDFKKYDV